MEYKDIDNLILDNNETKVSLRLMIEWLTKNEGNRTTITKFDPIGNIFRSLKIEINDSNNISFVFRSNKIGEIYYIVADGNTKFNDEYIIDTFMFSQYISINSHITGEQNMWFGSDNENDRKVSIDEILGYYFLI